LILETKDRHSKKAIPQEAYNKWRSSACTQRLFEELELAVVESYQDYLSNQAYSPDEISALVGVRDGAAQMVERVLEWAPAGVEGPDDED
jgi:hypothetical protein